MHQVEGANPSALTICPCSVVQTTRLPLMQKITGAKPVRDASFCPQSIWSDALLWYGSQLGAIPGGGSSFLGEWLSGNSRPHRSRICEPWRCKSSLAHQFQESKPQQTGTGLLIRYGEVATTSGSTNSLPGRLIVGQRPLKARMLVRFQPRQPISARW